MLNKFFSIIILFPLIFTISCSSQKISKPVSKPLSETIYNQNDGLKALTGNLKKSYIKHNPVDTPKKIAVIIFVNEDGSKSQFGKFVSNSIQQNIFDPGSFSLLERERIDSLLEEYDFNQSGLVKDFDYDKLGNLLGAELVIVGTLTPNVPSAQSPLLTINARFVDLTDGIIKSVASVNIKQTRDIMTKYNSKLLPKIKSLAGAYIIKFKNLEVSPQRQNGSPWDSYFGDPDLQLLFTTKLNRTTSLVLNSKTSSSVYKDRRKIDDIFFENQIILENDDFIDIRIYDKDALDDEIIGRYTLTKEDISNMLDTSRQQTISFDQVVSLSIELEPFK